MSPLLRSRLFSYQLSAIYRSDCPLKTSASLISVQPSISHPSIDFQIRPWTEGNHPTLQFDTPLRAQHICAVGFVSAPCTDTHQRAKVTCRGLRGRWRPDRIDLEKGKRACASITPHQSIALGRLYTNMFAQWLHGLGESRKTRTPGCPARPRTPLYRNNAPVTVKSSLSEV